MSKIPFSALSANTLVYRIATRTEAEVNFSFVAEDMHDVVLLISFRQTEGVVLANDCIDGVWGEEIRSPLMGSACTDYGSAPAGALPVAQNRLAPSFQGETESSIAVMFLGDMIQVALDGTVALQLPTERFKTERIAAIRTGPGVRRSSMTLDGVPLLGPDYAARLVFSERFVVEGLEFNPLSLHHGAQLVIDGLDESLDCIPVESTVTIEGVAYPVLNLETPLPGRIWAADPNSETRRVRLISGDDELAELIVSKDSVVAAIDALAAIVDPDTAIFEALTAVEHVRFGELFDRLSPKSAEFVRAVVSRFSLDSFASLPSPEAPPVAPLREQQTLEVSVANLIRDAFAAQIRAEPEADPLDVLRSQMMRFCPSPASARIVFLALAEHFCRVGRFEDLFSLWTARGNNPSHLEGRDNWSRSAALPFLMMHRSGAELIAALTSLPRDTGGWINTACIAWCLDNSFGKPGLHLSLGELERIVKGFMALVEAQAHSYWSRAHCSNLIGASARLVRRIGQLPVEQQKALVSFCLRCYGLSPQFWAELGGVGPELPAELAAGRSAFDTLARAVNALSQDGGSRPPPRAEIEAALRVFAAAKCHDLSRFRYELFGPAGMLPSGAETLAPLMAEGVDTSDALIRHLAFPGARPVPDAFSGIARRAVQERHPAFRGASHYELLRDTTRAAHQVLNHARAGDDDAASEVLDALTVRLGHLSAETAGHTGLGLGFSLLAGLLPTQANATKHQAAAFLAERLTALPAVEAKKLKNDRLLRSVFTRFHVEAIEEGSALAQSLLTRLQDISMAPLRRPAAPLPEMEALWRSASPLFDALVCIYSCRANLESRAQAVRDTWVGSLGELGVPHLFVVGDGPQGGALEGDVLAVDAPDSYEALPAKSIAMLRWVEANTSFAHVVKIDDDCLLDAEEFFHSLSYRQANYHGRTLVRAVGTKPRDWHMGKSRSARAKAELDKSPEPARYADGGSGYVLSREAMQKLTEVADSPEGRRLKMVSYSEDKLVGDLLALAGIYPRSENHFTAVMRTTHSSGRPVMRWENTFFPGRMSGVKLVHLDNSDNMRAIAAAGNDGTLHPRKIWPTTRKVQLGYNSAAMELISPEARLAEVSDVPVAVSAVVRNEMFMLPHFLAHYRRLGVKGFLITDNCSDDGTLEYLLEQPDVAVFSADTHFRQAAQGTDWKLAMMAQFRPGRWTLVADADELLVYRDWEKTSLEAHLATPAFAEADAVLLWMLDMYPQGPLSDASFDSGDPFAEAGFVDAEPFRENSLGRGSFSNRLTRTSALRHRLIPDSRPDLFVAEKVALLRYKPWMRSSVSMHYAAEVQMAAEPMILAHFKYNAEFRAKAEREIARGQYFNNAEEYKKYVDILSESRETIFDPAISVPWRDARAVRNLLG